MEPNFVDMAPSPSSHIQTLTKIGYTFNSAISDIIDNSIAAQSKNILIFASHQNSSVRIAICDDGFGMRKDELIQNMRIGCKDPDDLRGENDLGRFGSGLKTASFSQAEILTVITKTRETDFAGASWNIEEIKKSNSWKLKILSSSEILKELSNIPEIESLGTAVIWNNLHSYINSNDLNSVDLEDMLADQVTWLKKYIGLHFHKYLTGSGKITIYVNGDKILPLSPFLEHEDGYWEGPTQSFRMRQRLGKVEVKVHNIPHAGKLSNKGREQLEVLKSITSGQGFYVYRNNRLIIAGGWLGLSKNSQLGKLARVEVNIPSSLDSDWTTDVKKSSIEIPHQVKSRLKAAIETPVQQSKRAYKYRGVADKANDFWLIIENKAKHEISYQISSNNHELQTLLSQLNYNQKQMLTNYLKGLAANIPCHNIYHVMAEGKENINQDYDELEKALSEILLNG
ncbi:ATP-binding protein [Pseudidiomarina sp. GXY010]|uniref:ATP-binding protein n=1 Tax=Pseudidiomarina fusca TaxID=2965078 RepID=A0ABU3KZ31_9GAMM|nr:ATP-binding protein [Pseudidiomarina sp. GXY010]MDT7526721.1 ATP-binding protein [Pseudidiomarina sp. GXY010]